MRAARTATVSPWRVNLIICIYSYVSSDKGHSQAAQNVHLSQYIRLARLPVLWGLHLSETEPAATGRRWRSGLTRQADTAGYGHRRYQRKRGQAPFVRSTRRAVPAKGACPLFRPGAAGHDCQCPAVPARSVGPARAGRRYGGGVRQERVPAGAVELNGGGGTDMAAISWRLARRGHAQGDPGCDRWIHRLAE